MPPPVVVVTGASSGVGVSTALAFAERGYAVVLASRSEKRLRTVASQCRAAGAASALPVVTDVRDEAAVQALFIQAASVHGSVDVVVHTATVMAYGKIEKLPPELFSGAVNTAILGTFHVARSALAEFRHQRRGTLVVVNSLLGQVAVPEMGAYVTGKWGQAGLIRVLQQETRDEPAIKVCSVVPGGVNTPIYSLAANVTGRSPRPPIPVDPPERIAAAVLRCVDKPSPRVSVGIANPVIVLGFRLFPRLYDALVSPLLHFGGLTSKPTEPSAGNVVEPTPEREAEHGPWNRRLIP